MKRTDEVDDWEMVMQYIAKKSRNAIAIATLSVAFASGIAALTATMPAGAFAAGLDRALSPNETATGTISNENQVDVYKVAAPANGSVRFEIESTSDWIDYEVWSNSIEYCHNENPVEEKDGAVITAPVSVQSGDTIEVRISANLWERATYRVKAIVDNAAPFESEPNDEADSANAIAIGQTVTGVQNVGVEKDWLQYLDQDWFKHVAKKNGMYTVNVRVSEGEGVDVNTPGENDETKSPVAVACGTGWRSCEKVALRQGQSLCFAISAYSKWISENGYEARSGFGNVYQVKVGYTPFRAPAGTSLKSAKGGSRSLTAKWEGITGASGYQMRYARSSSMKGAKYKAISGSKTKVTVKRLKSGTRYYVQVRSYTKYPGKTLYSSWSNKRSAVAR